MLSDLCDDRLGLADAAHYVVPSAGFVELTARKNKDDRVISYVGADWEDVEAVYRFTAAKDGR